MMRLSTEEKNILIGTILGDAHVRVGKRGSRVEFNHSAKQKEYLFWKYEKLQRWCGAGPHTVTIHDDRYNKAYDQWRFSTRIDTSFEELRQLFYRDRTKIVPKAMEEMLTSPLSLAVWFMDDGGRRNDSYGLFLNTLSFTKEEHEFLQLCLQKNFGIATRIHWITDGYRIYIPSSEAQRFCEIVSPYILEMFRYKLSYNPVTTSFARLDRARDRSF
jgi:hypothetical protein